MDYSIVPILAKVNDTALCDTLAISVNQDNGISCIFAYRLICTGAKNVVSQANGVAGNFRITGDDYTAFSSTQSTSDRMLHAANYVCSKMNLSLSVPV